MLSKKEVLYKKTQEVYSNRKHINIGHLVHWQQCLESFMLAIKI